MSAGHGQKCDCSCCAPTTWTNGGFVLLAMWVAVGLFIFYSYAGV